MLKKPLVSIIIPTYNRLHTLPRALNSILQQTYSPIEIILIDDGSNDDTSDFIKKIIQTFAIITKNKPALVLRVIMA